MSTQKKRDPLAQRLPIKASPQQHPAGEPIVLGVDLDEVCFQYIEGLRTWLCETQDICPPQGEPTSWSMKDSGWFASEEDFRHYHGLAVEDGLYERLELLPDTRRTLWDLSRAGYQINIITSRFVNPGQHYKVTRQTAKALDDNKLPYSNLSFLSNKVLQTADAYIDDSPNNIRRLTEAGRFVIIRDMAYNRGMEGTRAISWDEVREILRERFGR